MNRSIAVVALIAAAPVLAAGADKLVKEAEKLYQAGKYLEAAEALKKAYDDKPHPNLIYNIARAYEQAGDIRGALEYYQRYIASKEGTDSALLKKSALAVDRLKALVEKDEAAKKERLKLEEEVKRIRERAAEEQRLAKEAEEKRQQEEARAAAQREADAEAAQRSRSGSRTISYIAGGAAVVGLGAGIFFGLGANAAKARFTAAETVADKQAAQAQTRSNALFADIGYGLAAAGGATAVIFFLRGREEPPAKTSWRILAGPGAAALEVRFE